jgi:hypothetical protein
MRKNILTVCVYPRDEVFDYPVLIPAPLLAALTALQTILDQDHGKNTEKQLIEISGIFFSDRGIIVVLFLFSIKKLQGKKAEHLFDSIRIFCLQLSHR